MSLPSLQTALDTGLPVTVCARPWARELLSGFGRLDFVDIGGRWHEDRATVSTHKKQHRHVHARGLLLPDSLSSAMVFKFAGIPSAGYRDDGRSLILRWPVRKPAASMHAVESWHYITRHALKHWNLPVHGSKPPARLGLKLTQKQHTDALDALQRAGLEPGRFVLIAPTATGLHHGQVKVWPHFDALTRQLQARGHTVAMCPPPSEADAAQKNAPTALRIDPLRLGAFATLTQLASLVICNDSGVSHLSAAGNARQLTLFGVTSREHTGPWSDQAACLGSATQWPTLAAVADKAESLLHQNPAPA